MGNRHGWARAMAHLRDGKGRSRLVSQSGDYTQYCRKVEVNETSSDQVEIAK